MKTTSLTSNLFIAIPKKLDFLLIVRGLAAISVVYWHLSGHLDIENYLVSFIVIPGRLAVWIFFLMSGYLVSHGLYYGRYNKSFKGISRFYINRLLRIYPLFLVVSLVALTMSNSEYLIDAQFIAKELLLLQWNHEYQLNGVFWTLGVEIQFYFLVPLLVFGSQIIFPPWLNRGVCLYGLAIIAVWLYSKSYFFVSWDMRSIMGGMTNFVVGIACAINKNRIISLGRKKYSVVIFAFLVLIFIVYFNHNYAINAKMNFISNLIGFGLISLHIILEDRRIFVNRPVKILLVIGVLSYGIYAWHGLLTKYAVFTDNLIYHLLVAIALAYVTYVTIERPLMRFKS
jgi:peptidoglycan/LPS O-acetylase OafA/YrhL